MTNMHKHVFWMLSLTLTLSLVACSSDDADDKADKADAASDDGLISFGDGSPLTDGSGVSDTSSAPDILAPGECPGGVDCPCKENADCDNAQCIDTPSGKQCARPCGHGSEHPPSLLREYFQQIWFPSASLKNFPSGVLGSEPVFPAPFAGGWI